MNAEERMEICKKCPLYHDSEFGAKCNNHKYLGPNEDVSWFSKNGYVRGCGCYLFHKTKDPTAKCPAGKW